MMRSLTLLAVVACMAAPAFAQNTGSSSSRDRSRDRRQDRMDRDHSDRNRMDRDHMDGNRPGARPMTTLSPYPLYERGMGHRFWNQGYVLTPLAFRRLRHAGFTRDEAFMIANASRVTGIDPIEFEQAVYNGMYARSIGYEYGIDPKELTRVLPEWKTQAWADAAHDSLYTKDRLDVLY